MGIILTQYIGGTQMGVSSGAIRCVLSSCILDRPGRSVTEGFYTLEVALVFIRRDHIMEQVLFIRFVWLSRIQSVTMLERSNTCRAELFH